MSNPTATNRDAIDQLAESFVARFRAGERPSIEEFALRFPKLTDELRELLPALVLLEQHAMPEETQSLLSKTKKSVTPRQIGDFTIVREIARGGMGVVYEAIQQSLGRHVALKVLSAPGLLNPTHLERFRLEARAAARLHHTHIVPVFGVGEHDGLHFYAMQFIPGQSLDVVIDELRRLRREHRSGGTLSALHSGSSLSRGSGRIGTASREKSSTDDDNATDLTSSHSGRAFYHSVARLGLQVTEALTYAHNEGILHRDIKPSNLLLDAKGNVWITDFGLAKAEDTDGLTQTGDFVGTLRYMAPERLEGWSDRRSDIYGLGATLYELLTLEPFLETSSRGQLVDKILNETPPVPSRYNHSIPRDLETIVLKAIAKEPTARYRTGEAMAEDLRRYLADRPILARRSTFLEQLVRWRRRNPIVAALIATVVVALILGMATSSYFAASSMRQTKIARDEAIRSERVAQFLKDFLQAAGLNHESEFAELNSLFDDSLIRSAENNTEGARLLRLRSTLFARIGRWDESAADCLAANKLALDGGDWSFDSAIVLLRAGHKDEYRRVCHAYLERAAEKREFLSADMAAKVSLLLPVEGTDFARACELADFAATETGPGSHVACVRLGKALAEYRRAQFDSAIDWTERAISSEGATPRWKAAAFLIRAAACARLQQIESARTAFDNGVKLMNQPRDVSSAFGNFGDTWCDLTIAEYLRREMELLIAPPDAPVNPTE